MNRFFRKSRQQMLQDEKFQRYALYAIGEITLVVIGILIALFINNWQTSINNQRFVDRVLIAIETELAENKTDMEEVIPLQLSLIDTVYAYLDNDTVSIAETISRNSGFQVPGIKNTAWRSFLNAKMELIDYRTISILTDIDEYKKLMDNKLNKMIEFVYANMNSKDALVKQNFIWLLEDLIDTESSILERHEKFLERHLEHKPE